MNGGGINLCSDLNAINIAVTSNVLLKKKQYKSSQQRSQICIHLLFHLASKKKAGSPMSQKHYWTRMADITDLQRANFCLCACLSPINLTEVLVLTQFC